MIVITSGCATFQPWAAAIGGIVGGLIYLPGSYFVLHILKVDDPVDAVHTLSETLNDIHFIRSNKCLARVADVAFDIRGMELEMSPISLQTVVHFFSGAAGVIWCVAQLHTNADYKVL